MSSSAIRRRSFLQRTIGASTAIGIGTALPYCFAQAAQADSTNAERILVVVQLSGGNDGLNTVIPYTDELYYESRPKLAIPKTEVLTCGDDLGFHPAMSGMRDLLEDGRAVAISGVGYERPNRSHFESMDIWHTCRRKDEPRRDGWLGRYLDSQSKRGGSVPALHLGTEQQPLAIISQNVRVPTVRDVAEFQLRGPSQKQLRSLLDAGILDQPASGMSNESNSLLGFLESSTSAALEASARVAEATSAYQTTTTYPDSRLGQKLKTIAQLIDSGLTTSVYYVELDGFDTHARQSLAHSTLLKEWSEAVTAFVQDLVAHEHGDRVCVMTFSEFGRRVRENASAGTDHGAAGPMFLAGGGLRAGLFGDTPSLSDLQEGDLKHQIDFRQVYATVLQAWLGVDPLPILGKQYPTLPLFA